MLPSGREALRANFVKSTSPPRFGAEPAALPTHLGTTALRSTVTGSYLMSLLELIFDQAQNGVHPVTTSTGPTLFHARPRKKGTERRATELKLELRSLAGTPFLDNETHGG